MKKLLALLLFLPALAWAQCNPFASNQILTASGLNAALQAACITSGTISGLSAPLPVLSGGTGVTTSTGSGSVVLSASPTLSGTIGGNLTFSGSITPSQTLGIVGTTTNNNANAGSAGEFVSSTVLSGSAVSLTSATATNVTSISLTAGDWDVWGSCAFAPAGTTVVTLQACWTSSASATTPTLPNNGGETLLSGITSAAGAATNAISAGTQRFSLSATTTIYLGVFSSFSTSTETAYGFIAARRRR